MPAFVSYGGRFTESAFNQNIQNNLQILSGNKFRICRTEMLICLAINTTVMKDSSNSLPTTSWLIGKFKFYVFAQEPIRCNLSNRITKGSDKWSCNRLRGRFVWGTAHSSQHLRMSCKKFMYVYMYADNLYSIFLPNQMHSKSLTSRATPADMASLYTLEGTSCAIEKGTPSSSLLVIFC